MMPEEQDLIWIQDAEKEFGRSQAWLYDQIKKGHLTRYIMPGEGRTYLNRDELKNLVRPRPATSKREQSGQA